MVDFDLVDPRARSFLCVCGGVVLNSEREKGLTEHHVLGFILVPFVCRELFQVFLIVFHPL